MGNYALGVAVLNLGRREEGRPYAAMLTALQGQERVGTQERENSSSLCVNMTIWGSLPQPPIAALQKQNGHIC